MRVEKHVVPVFGAVVFIWLVVPSFKTAVATVLSDIIKTTCVPWRVYSSEAMERAVGSLILVVQYLLPLTLMAFCYARIVYTLKCAVTQSRIFTMICS